MSAEDAVPQFHDKDSELRYWKSRYYDLQDTLRDTEASLHDFMDSSKELEKEMDREINASSAKISELQLRSERLKGDVDEWKTKYQRALSDHNKTLAELNRELSTLRESHNIYKTKLRDMELDNDELENAERMVASSLNDMESRYNKAIERTALLEEELVEKSRLEEENQRLKDELQEVNEELAVLRESRATSRFDVRSHTPAEASSSNGRASVDEMHINDLTGRQRPASRSSMFLGARPPSRTSAKNSPPMPKSSLPSIPTSNKVKSLGSSRAGFQSHARRDSRDTRASMDDSPASGLIASPSSHTVRSRQSIGPGGNALRASVRAPRSTIAGSSRDQPGGSKTMIGDMFKRMRILEKRLADTRNGFAVNDVQSAIPRPSSRLSSSIGPSSGVNLTPRRSIDSRRDDLGTPSSIPVPLSKSTSVRRPTSRLSMALGDASSQLPSSVRCQTPTMESGATLEFLDQDPSKLRRRSHLSMAPSSTINSSSSNNNSSYTASNLPSTTNSVSTRPRGSTLTLSGQPIRSDPLRKSVHPGTGRPAPPVSWKPGQSINRPRSSSIGSNS